MKRMLLVLLGCVLVLAAAIPASAGDAPKVLAFDSMTGVAGPLVGKPFPERGVPGGGLAWIITGGEGELHADGAIEVHVRGLVLARTGKNPIGNFRALVSCLRLDGTVVNRSTGLFPASTQGDSDIEDVVTGLPNPCFAPIVFVTSPTGSWFAVHGAALEFETMVGNAGAFVGARGKRIQGVAPAGAPWKIAAAEGSLGEDFEVHVRGLVLLNGINPVDHFRAIVSCVTIESGIAVAKTVRTDLFPATVPGGDSDIEATLQLPNPCFAPLVFVTSPGGGFFAVTGFKS